MSIVLLTMPVLPATAGPAGAAVTPVVQSDPDLRIDTEPTGITVDLSLPAYSIEQVEREGTSYQAITLQADHWTQTAQPGTPQLPERGLLLAVPPTGDVTIESVSAPAQRLSGRFSLAPAPDLIPEFDEAGFAVAATESWQADARAYAADQWLPAAQAEIVEEGWMRGMRFVRLALHPFQYNPAQGALQVAATMQVRLSFSEPASSAAALPADPIFDPILAASFPNYGDAAGWRSRPAPMPMPAGASRVLDGDWVKITVDRDGLYQVTYNDLLAAGVPAATLNSLDPHTLRVEDNGVEIAIVANGEANGVFEPGDSILFYGLRDTDYYSDDLNVYWLTWGGANGLRMAQQNGTPNGAASANALLTTTRAENNLEYKPQRPFLYLLEPLIHDHWYWAHLAPTFSLTVDNVALDTTSNIQPQLSVWLAGDREVPGNYLLTVNVNAQPAGQLAWSNVQILNGTLTIPSGLLVAGSNALQLTTAFTSYNDTAWLDWLKLTYPYNRAFRSGATFHQANPGTWHFAIDNVPDSTPWVLNLADPTQPARVTNAAAHSQGSTYQIAWDRTTSAGDQFLVIPDADVRQPLAVERYTAGDLLDPNQQVDYLVIVHEDFQAGFQPLVAHHVAAGLSVRSVTTQEIYDLFNDGELSFEAIRDYLAYAYSNYLWPAPAYVALVGDGNIDFRHYKFAQFGRYNWLPPYVGVFDYWGGVGISDLGFVLLQGDDLMGEMLPGRFPVNNATDLQVMVNKTIDYEPNFPIGRQFSTLWLADDTDEAGNFHAASDDAIDLLTPDFTATRFYWCINPPPPAAPTCPTEPYIYAGTMHNSPGDPALPAMRAAFQDSLSQGHLFLHFTGHGGITTWGHEQFFRSYWVPNITNGDAVPFVLVSSCASGYFAHFQYDSLDETLARAAGKGTIGGYTAGTFDILHSQSVLLEHFLDAVMRERITRPSFAAAVSRARTFADLPLLYAQRTLLGHGFTGDPALVLLQPQGDCAVADLDCDGDRDTFDIQLAANAWGSIAWVSANYNPRADLNQDGRVDIRDVQTVAGYWGLVP